MARRWAILGLAATLAFGGFTLSQWYRATPPPLTWSGADGVPYAEGCYRRFNSQVDLRGKATLDESIARRLSQQADPRIVESRDAMELTVEDLVGTGLVMPLSCSDSELSLEISHRHWEYVGHLQEELAGEWFHRLEEAARRNDFSTLLNTVQLLSTISEFLVQQANERAILAGFEICDWTLDVLTESRFVWTLGPREKLQLTSALPRFRNVALANHLRYCEAVSLYDLVHLHDGNAMPASESLSATYAAWIGAPMEYRLREWRNVADWEAACEEIRLYFERLESDVLKESEFVSTGSAMELVRATSVDSITTRVRLPESQAILLKRTAAFAEAFDSVQRMALFVWALEADLPNAVNRGELPTIAIPGIRATYDYDSANRLRVFAGSEVNVWLEVTPRPRFIGSHR